jgi:uncharacterized protein (TIGR00661 family)
MNILFVITGVGYGDATREHAVIEEFLKRDKKTKILITAYGNSYEYLKNKYNTIKIKGYKFPGEHLKFKTIPFALKNILLPLKWFYLSKTFRKRVKEFNPDIIISDFEPLGIILSKYLKKKCISIFGFDPVIYKKINKNLQLRLQAKYLVKLYNQSDYVIIPSFVNKGKHKNIIYVNPIIRKLDNKKVKKTKKEHILVLLGGSTFGNILAKKINKIADEFDENFIIIGSKLKLEKKSNVEYYNFKENIQDYIKTSKAVITLGGKLTLAEALYFKKPVMAFPIKNHVEQLTNVKALENNIFVCYDLKNLKTKLNYFLNNLNRFQRKIPKLRFNGAKQVVDIIYRLEK